MNNVSSPCPRFVECGSCSWSDLSYPDQLAKKLLLINEALLKSNVETRCVEIIPSPRTEHYRNRMDFVIGFKGQVGLRERGKWWRIIDNHCCMVSDTPIEEAFAIAREWVLKSGLTFYDRKKHIGFLRYAVVRATRKGERLVTIVTSVPKDGDEEAIARIQLGLLAEALPATTVVWSINNTTGDVSFGQEDRVIAGEGVIHEEIEGALYRISPHAFFQTNSYASPALLSTVKEFCGDLAGKTLLDLYCGTGFFSVALAKSAARAIGVELSSDAIRDAKANAALNGVSVEFHDAKAEAFSWKPKSPDVVIVDPPRSGLHPDALKDLISSGVKKIVYISCGFERFAEEMKSIGLHYKIAAIKAVDLFPHTPHVELVTVLEKIV